MKIHEYQAKSLFKQHNIPVPQGDIAENADEAAQIADSLGGYPVVVKAQIHAGGRGKGKTSDGQSGVALVKSAAEAEHVAARLMVGKIDFDDATLGLALHDGIDRLKCWRQRLGFGLAAGGGRSEQ